MAKSSTDWLDRLPGDGVYSLRDAESNLLQVLLSEFKLFRHGNGFQLKVAFDEETDTLRRREAKKYVQDRMPDFFSKCDEIQDQLEAVFFRGEKEYIHDPKRYEFAFRYASGGTLPILEISDIEYYCLFYRDVFPVGWNIANGACDSLSELLDPEKTIERELREELIIWDLTPGKPRDYVFETIEMPEFIEARNLWRKYLARSIGRRRFKKIPLDVDWSSRGPDTLGIRFGSERKADLKGFYLNVNASDFGIELDRIGKIKVDPGAILLDGEINDNRLLNRPIGLFEVRRTQAALRNGSDEFLPDQLFHTAGLALHRRPDSVEELRSFVEDEFFKHLRDNDLRKANALEDWSKIPPAPQFDLCPVSRQIIRRHMDVASPVVMISYSRTDRSEARRLRGDLEKAGVRVWIDEANLTAGRVDRGIERALDQCSHVLLLATGRSVESDYVRDEIECANKLGKSGIVARLEPCTLPMRVGSWIRLEFVGRYSEGLAELKVVLLSGSATQKLKR